MKTLRSTTKFIGSASLLALAFGFTSALALADPSPQSSQLPTATKQTDTAKPSAPAAMACSACKTTVLVAPDEIRPNRLGVTTRSPVTGFTHSCGHCGGKLTALKGKMTNAMQGNCAMCGKDAERCIAAQHPANTA